MVVCSVENAESQRYLGKYCVGFEKVGSNNTDVRQLKKMSSSLVATVWAGYMCCD